MVTAFLDPYRDGQVVLAGDPKQLGPVLMSNLAKYSGLDQSMLLRFINYPLYQRNPDMFPDHNGYNPKVITHLIQNYRSVPEILHNYSKLFYNSLLVASVSNKNNLIFILQYKEKKLLSDFNLLIFLCRNWEIIYQREYC